MTPTPETLRELADRLEHVSFQGCVAEIALIRAAADAWQEDIDVLRWFAREYQFAINREDDDRYSMIALRQRLEAAEKELDKLDGKGVTELWCDRDWDYVTLKDGTRVSFYVYHKPAALAGEEKPSA